MPRSIAAISSSEAPAKSCSAAGRPDRIDCAVRRSACQGWLRSSCAPPMYRGKPLDQERRRFRPICEGLAAALEEPGNHEGVEEAGETLLGHSERASQFDSLPRTVSQMGEDLELHASEQGEGLRRALLQSFDRLGRRHECPLFVPFSAKPDRDSRGEQNPTIRGRPCYHIFA